MAAESNVTVTWAGKKQFVGTDSTKHSVVMSSHDPENGTGVKPSDMLLVALGGCSAVDIVSILAKQRKTLTGLEVRISGTQADDKWPRPFERIHVEYILHGKDLSEKGVARAIELSEGTYCSVGATVRGVSEVTSSFQIINEE